MKCKVFYGRWDEAMDTFNEWAKGKALTKDVIIHTNAHIEVKDGNTFTYLAITVYHPEDPLWDKVQTE